MTNPYDHYNALRSRISEKEAELRELRTEAENEALRVFRELCFKEGDVVEFERGVYQISKIKARPFDIESGLPDFSVFGKKRFLNEVRFRIVEVQIEYSCTADNIKDRITIISRAE